MTRMLVVPESGFGKAAAEAFLAALRFFESPVVGLPTGTTPIPLYERLREMAEAGEVDVSGIRPFAIDEYVTSSKHGCSNRAYFERYWRSIPGAQLVTQFEPEAADLMAEVERYEGLLEEAGGLDLVVLGIGVNGHLAFNEPGGGRESRTALVPLAESTRRAASQCFGDETPREGLTLGLSELLGSKRLVLLASGASKADVVARALDGAINEECPASFVQDHPHLTVVLDEAAASGIRSR
jgi:glucosamine-6-phosphate deaminase